MDLNAHFLLMKKAWPSAIVARSEIGRFSGGILTPGNLANLDCLGEGPERIRIGRKVAYPVDTLISWLAKKSTKLEPKGETVETV